MEYILWKKGRVNRGFARMSRKENRRYEARRLIARNVRKLRSQHKMTQEDLAAAAGVDRSYISEIENERFSASCDLVENLANVFQVEIYEMFHPNTADKTDEANPS